MYCHLSGKPDPSKDVDIFQMMYLSNDVSFKDVEIFQKMYLSEM